MVLHLPPVSFVAQAHNGDDDDGRDDYEVDDYDEVDDGRGKVDLLQGWTQSGLSRFTLFSTSVA